VAPGADPGDGAAGAYSGFTFIEGSASPGDCRHPSITRAETQSIGQAYRPVEGPVPRTAARVSADLTREGTAAVVPFLGADVARGADALAWRGGGAAAYGIDRAYRTQDLARGGTVLLGAGALGGLSLLYGMLGGPGVFRGTGGTGGGNGG
jgi:hypothetical protein